MGCCGGSANAQANVPNKQAFNTKTKPFTFQQRPYKGEKSEHYKQSEEMAVQFIGNMKPEDLLYTEDNYLQKRQEIEGLIEGMMEPHKEELEKFKKDFTITQETVKVRDGAEIGFEVIRHNDNKSQSAAGYIYAHGGGGWALKARHETNSMCQTALNLNTVVFNVDYRLAPEYKCPKGQEDFVDAINHIHANASKFGIDPKKICLAGCSGGGWILVGAVNLLAKANDLAKIRAVFIHTGQLSNSQQNLPEEELGEYEKLMATPPPVLTSVYKLLCGKDWEASQNDDQLFPGRTTDQILLKYPPTVVWTSEWDFFRRDNEIFAARLKKLGKLAAVSNMPCTGHGYHEMEADSEFGKAFKEEEKLAFDCLVHP